MDSKRRIGAACSGLLERKPKVLIVATFGAVASLGVIVASAAPPSQSGSDAEINRHAQAMIDEGRKIFRYDTFGSERFWATRCNCIKQSPARRTAASVPAFHQKRLSQLVLRSMPKRCRML
jgi:hypothetical protein